MAPQSKLPARIEQALALLKPEGSWTRELCTAMGIADARLCIVMTAAIAEGRAVMHKAGRNAVYFPTLADADAFAVKFAIDEAARLKEAKRKMNRLRQERHGPELGAKRRDRRRRAALAKSEERAQQRAMRAAEAEVKKAKARQERDAQATLKQRDTAERASLRARLRTETKAASQLVFKKGTTVAAASRSAWADMPAFIPDGVEPVELPNTLRDRFTVSEVPPLFSSLRPGQYIATAPAWVQAVTA